MTHQPPPPQIRGVRGAGDSNKWCTRRRRLKYAMYESRRLKYAVYEAPATELHVARAAGDSNTQCTRRRRLKYAVYEGEAKHQCRPAFRTVN
jgi:hypothetical protein